MAQHALRTTERALALARLGRKYEISAKYRLHPLPHGTQRRAVAQLLKRWGWVARPLQPEKGDATGAAWLVGAESEPPGFAMPVGDSFVLINKAREGSVAKPGPPGVCGTARTLKRVQQTDAAVEPDPWQNRTDPWSKARSSSDGGKVTAVSLPVAAKLDKLESGLKQEMQSIVRKELADSQSSSASTEHEARFKKLEVGMSELKLQNQKFEGWFQSFGKQVNEQSGALAAVHSTLQSQQQELSQVCQDMQTTVASAVGSVQSELAKQLASQLAGQFEQIQELFADNTARRGE